VYAKRLLLVAAWLARLKNKMKKRLVFLMCFLAPQIESVKAGSQSDPKSQKYQITYARRYLLLGN